MPDIKIQFGRLKFIFFLILFIFLMIIYRMFFVVLTEDNANIKNI
jgi:hypothetical protein